MAGGVIKILDYAAHAAAVGPVTIWGDPLPETSAPIRSVPVVDRLLADETVRIRPIAELRPEMVGPRDLLLFTEPTHIGIVDRLDVPPDRTVHLVQGTRHANPNWNEGRNYRLLHRPMVRIAVSDPVADIIAPHVDGQFPTHTIVEGHDLEFFSLDRPAFDPARPLRVLFMTWKSNLGDRVATALAEEPGISFTAVRTPLGWPSLRNRYRAADVFLGAPGPEEGFYLPGLEAMAADCALVMAIVGGNASYCEPGINMIAADFGDVDDHVRALRSLRADPELLETLRTGGRDTTARHTLARERAQFIEILRNPTAHYDALTATGSRS